MTDQKIRYLVQQFFRNQCTPEEKGELARWIEQSANDDAIKKVLEQAWKEFEPLENMRANKADAILAAIFSDGEEVGSIPARVPLVRLWWKRLSVAAVLILIVATGGYILFFKDYRPSVASSIPKSSLPVNNDANPGCKRAVLTLSDGSKIILDTLSTGILAQQGNTIIKNIKGELTYTPQEKNFTEPLYNTLSTHRGELYPLILSDGSKIWLNSASSIRFPVAFFGSERLVEITGEAYFEVAKNVGMPFKVKVNGMEIAVLGTHFNVNAYADESTIKTTLIEGSIKLTNGSAHLLLSPQQQADVRENGKIELIKKADIEEAVSWKSGYFHFNNASLEEVMHQLSRWYDVDVVYENRESRQYFGGDIEKNLHLSQVLKILEKSQVHFKIEGKKLIVIK